MYFFEYKVPGDIVKAARNTLLSNIRKRCWDVVYKMIDNYHLGVKSLDRNKNDCSIKRF